MKVKHVHPGGSPHFSLLRFVALVFASLALTNFGWAVPVDLKSYDRACGVELKEDGGSLLVKWRTRVGSTELTLNLSGKGALVKSVAVGQDGSKPFVVLRDADPFTVLTIGQRDLKKRGGWTIFFDRTSRKPSESGKLGFKLDSVVARSKGNRCVVDLGGLEGQSFSGKWRFRRLRISPWNRASSSSISLRCLVPPGCLTMAMTMAPAAAR